MQPDLQKQIDQLKIEIENLKRSFSIPREVETAFIERLGLTNTLKSSGIGSAGNTIVISAFPFNLPANPSGTVAVNVNGTIYNLLYK